MRITNRERIFISVAILVLLAALYYSLFYRDLSQEIMDIKHSIRWDSSELEKIIQSKGNVQSLYRDIDSLKAKTSKITDNETNSQIEPRIIVFLEDSIKNLGLSTKIRFGDPIEYDRCDVIPVTLDLESSYINCRKILGGIEKSPWPYSIDYIKTSKREGTPGHSSNSWDVEMVISFVSFHSDKEP
ncbi:MAG TPA: hypothetical protein VFD89_03685 [Clostridia bacterium]|nr:hypothetical protein [Clostridia bacterium]